MYAIRLKQVGRYFAPRSGLGTPKPREAMRALMSMFGFAYNAPADNSQPAVTFAAGGHVLKALDLDIEAGTVVAIAGASGSGKTTLLRLLAGALPPTEGRIELTGTVSALLDVGDNLDPSRTAHENIDDQRRLKRIGRDMAETYARDVIAFAGLQGFEDVPVERYSTGMLMRLSVALAMEGDPPIFVIDDVLGVGDLAFQQDCINRLLRLKDAGSTIVMVAADDTLVARLANRVVKLSGGTIVSDGPPQAGNNIEGSVADLSWEIANLLPENEAVALRKVAVDSTTTADGIELDIAVELAAKLPFQRCRPLLDVVFDKVLVLRSLYPGYCESSAPGPLRFSVRVPAHMLSARRYRIDVHLVTTIGTQVHALKATGMVWLDVRRDGQTAAAQASAPVLVPPFDWEIGEAR